MNQMPAFEKPDRYKMSSYQSYNFKMPSRYDTCFWQKFCHTADWDRVVVSELRPDTAGLRILDVGCATGRLLEQLAEAGATELFGIDLAPRILEVARVKLLRAGATAELRTADAEESLPWGGDFFDVVTLTGVLHHFFRPGDALGEVLRVLRPGGRLLVIDPCFFPPVRQLLNLALGVAPHDGDFRFYSQTEAAGLLAEHGFEIKQVRRLGLWAFLADAVKPGRTGNELALAGNEPGHADSKPGLAANGKTT